MSSLLDDYKRTSRSLRCPICGRDHYCLVSREGGSDPSRVICTKVESPIRFGEAGWLHALRDDERRPTARRTIEIEFEPKDYRTVADRYARVADLEAIAKPLGLDAGALRRLGVGLDPDSGASTWPELDAGRRVVGILRRFRDGSKKLRTGDKAGLFMPRDLPLDLAGERLLVVEGGSDTAAGLGLGRWTVGRHAALAGLKDAARLVRTTTPTTVSIVADRDESGTGLSSARRLADRLAPYCGDVRVVETPEGVKDLRDWIRRGDAARELPRAEEAAR